MKQTVTHTRATGNDAVWYEVHGTALAQRHGQAPLSDALTLKAYEMLVRTRRIDETLFGWSKQARLGTYPPCKGQEVCQVAPILALRDEDWMLPTFREFCALINRGETIEDILLFLKGYEEANQSSARNLPIAAAVASQLPHAVGLAWDAQLRGEEVCALTFLGDGATSKGDFHEALNIAAVRKLPVVFFCTNNGWALSTPSEDQYACPSIALRAAAYGVRGMRVDGTRLVDTYTATSVALEHCRSGGGPVLIEALASRMGPHAAADDPQAYGHDVVDDTVGEEIELLRKTLERGGLWSAAKQRALERTIDKELTDSLKAATKSAKALSKDLNPAFDHVFEDGSDELEHQKAGYCERGISTTRTVARIAAADVETHPLTMVEALNNALWEEMGSNPNLVIMGQDIADLGGVFRVTAGLLDTMGPDRVINMPIAESGMVGAAIGMAIGGRPTICEIQFAGFSDAAFTQLRVHASRFRSRTRGKLTVPLVVRGPYGAGTGAPECHADAMEMAFAQIPGLKVVVPSSPRRARALLKAAIRDPDPVIFLEPIGLYRTVQEEVPASDELLPLGTAMVLMQGEDVTLVSYGAMLAVAMETAADAQDHGCNVEVIDLMSLAPLDSETVARSVEKTGSLVVVHESVARGDIGGELAARLLQSRAAPFKFERVCVPDIPLPYPGRDAQIIPTHERVLDAVLRASGKKTAPRPRAKSRRSGTKPSKD